MFNKKIKEEVNKLECKTKEIIKIVNENADEGNANFEMFEALLKYLKLELTSEKIVEEPANVDMNAWNWAYLMSNAFDERNKDKIVTKYKVQPIKKTKTK